MNEVLANTMIVAILQYLSVSKEHILHLKLIRYHMSTVYYNKAERKKEWSFEEL